MVFNKYMHVERLTEGNSEIDGILNGEVYIYPKLDGSNHCIWWDDDVGEVRCASRNHVLTPDRDSTKFVQTYFLSHKVNAVAMATEYYNMTFYGEFMRPHVIKDYADRVWDDWFVFDVYDRNEHRWLSFEEYQPMLDKYKVSYIPPMKKMDSPSIADVYACVDDNHFMMMNDAVGEGIVIKNYAFVNVYGRTTWAKVVRDEFRVAYRSTPEERGEDVSIENKIISQYLNSDFIEKEYHKFVDEYGEWSDKMIPSFIKHVIREWWADYSYDVIATQRCTIDMNNFRKIMSRKIVRKVMSMQ